MKIVAISDLHGTLPELQPCDVVVICGDIVPPNIQKNYEASLAWLSGPFQNWALNLDCKKVIFIAGTMILYLKLCVMERYIHVNNI